MKSKKIQSLILSALFAALCCVATLLFPIPTPFAGGYVNLGDGFCLLAGLFLPLPFGPLAAAVGSALADILLGYLAFAPATFVIKGGIALVCYLLYRGWGKKITNSFVLVFLCSIGSVGLTPLGYFIYEWTLYGSGAVLNLIPNALQALTGVVVAILLHPLLKPILRRDFTWK